MSGGGEQALRYWNRETCQGQRQHWEGEGSWLEAASGSGKAEMVIQREVEERRGRWSDG